MLFYLFFFSETNKIKARRENDKTFSSNVGNDKIIHKSNFSDENLQFSKQKNFFRRAAEPQATHTKTAKQKRLKKANPALKAVL